ncbi:MAG: hypothetical protein FJ006_11335 [Chloroflexi bacterium]|nr:hypothetical protein [Chloroflexota bacterium]
MAVKQAIKPDNVFFSLPSLAIKKEAPGATDDEVALTAMAETDGWAVLEGFIENVSRDLDEANGVAIGQGASFEEIGKNTVVISMAKGIIGKILDKVNDAKEAVENARAIEQKRK